VRAREFAETEYDGDPVRERLEAAASVPINMARQVGTISKIAGSAFETTGQTIGTALATGSTSSTAATGCRSRTT
jgi:hypothetical protein